VITNFGGGLLGSGGNGDFGGEVSGGGSGGLPAWLGLSAGGGAASSGLGLPAGAGPGGAAGAIGSLGGPLAGLLGKIFPHGAGGISGSTLGTLGIGLGIDGLIRGGWLGALETAGGGALTGFAIAGPIGALVGGIIGGIAGVVRWLFGGNKKKKQADALEAQLAVDIKTVMDSYDLFQTDYNGTISSLETLRTNYTAQFKKIGGIHRQIVESDALLNTAEEQVKATQAERNRRAGLAFGPAEFRVGGFVGPGLGGPAPAWFAGTAMHFAGGGAVPAILHEGEYVMRPEAVSRWGRGKLESMNSGGGGDTHVHLQINAIDARSFESFLNRDGGDKILRFIMRAESQGKW